jgi:hypothetical protein
MRENIKGMVLDIEVRVQECTEHHVTRQVVEKA